MSLAEEMRLGIKQLGIMPVARIQEKLLDYLALLKKWNRVYNLTAIRDPHQMVSYHLLDSLSAIKHLWPGQWLDVGCGAGLPGMVLAISQPDWHITMLDSNSKKTSFVQQAIIELELNNARVICTRVEDWRPAEHFDGIISRAYAELGDFLSSTRHLIAEQGRWAAMKGSPEQELGRLPSGCRVERVIPLQVPGLHAARSLVIATCNLNEAT